MKKKIRKIFERFKIFLTEDEKYKLYKKLMEINSSKLKNLNEKFKRKRMININYLIRKVLQEMGN